MPPPEGASGPPGTKDGAAALSRGPLRSAAPRSVDPCVTLMQACMIEASDVTMMHRCAFTAAACEHATCTQQHHQQCPSARPGHRHFLEVDVDDVDAAEKLAAHQGRKSVGGIALHAVSTQVLIPHTASICTWVPSCTRALIAATWHFGSLAHLAVDENLESLLNSGNIFACSTSQSRVGTLLDPSYIHSVATRFCCQTQWTRAAPLVGPHCGPQRGMGGGADDKPHSQGGASAGAGCGGGGY